MNKRASLAFLALCLVNTASIVLNSLLSITWPVLLKLAVHDGVVAVILLGSCLWLKLPLPNGRTMVLAGWATLLFLLTPLISHFAGSALPGNESFLVLAAVPFFTVFGMAQLENGDQRLLLPAALGLGGLALILPFRLPSTASGFIWLAAMVVAAALVSLAGIRLSAGLRGESLAWGATLANGLTASFAFLVWCVPTHDPPDLAHLTVLTEVGWGLLVDLPLMLLTFWLLKALNPIAFSTRFLLVPLLTLLASMVLLRPTVPWTTWAGLALLAGTSAWLVSRAEDSSRTNF